MNDDMFGKLVVSYMTDLHNGVLEEDQVLKLIKDNFQIQKHSF